MTTYEVWQPSRAERRQRSGSECIVCHNRLHFTDLALIAPAIDGDVRKMFELAKPVHPSCALLLTDTDEPRSAGDQGEETTQQPSGDETTTIPEEA